MKHMKKAFALILALAMVLTMSAVTAFAAEGESSGYTVTITKDSSDKATHVYEAYQIFAGKLDASGTKLSDITWGTGIDNSKLGTLATAIEALRTGKDADGYEALTATSSAAKFADAIEGLNATSDDETAQKLATAIGAALGNKNSGTSGATSVTGLAAGYYLIKDKADSLTNAENGAYTRYILQVVKSVTVTEKADVPSVTKKVKDVNDSAAEGEGNPTGWQDSADYDIGDAVPFQLTAKTGSKTSDYTKYHVIFEDKQSAGLDAPTSYTVTVLGKTFTVNATGDAPESQTTEKGTKISVAKVDAAKGYTFAIKVTFENSTSGAKLNGEVNSKDVVVTYSSTLNSSAVIGKDGNPNEVYLQYSNNPNSTDDSEEGKTPEDKVIVFTYKTTVNKVNENNTALTGADFALYKEVQSSVTGAQTGAAIKSALATSNPDAKTTAFEDSKYYVVAGTKTGTTNGSEFSFNGIDDGNYVLVETTVPDGYNGWESVAFTVAATHDVDSADPKLTSLTGGNLVSGEFKETGIITTNITNKSGAELPTTGGIGTVIFYVLGAALVIGCGIALISKRRVSSK